MDMQLYMEEKRQEDDRNAKWSNLFIHDPSFDWQYHAGTRMLRRRHPHGFMVDMVHLKDYHARWFVMNHIGRNAKWRQFLPETGFWALYDTIADGFGRYNAPDVDFDWSHFRDSSPAAFREMADYIVKTCWIYADFDEVYKNWLNDLATLAADPDLPGYGPLEYYDLWHRDD